MPSRGPWYIRRPLASSVTASNISQIAERGWWIDAMTTCDCSRTMRLR
jgi:hypothetical protein